MPYNPGKAPVIADKDAQEILKYITRELDRISAALEETETFVHFTVLYVEPKKLSDGILAFADGTSWNPGGGRGLYIYDAGVWSLVHAL